MKGENRPMMLENELFVGKSQVVHVSQAQRLEWWKLDCWRHLSAPPTCQIDSSLSKDIRCKLCCRLSILGNDSTIRPTSRASLPRFLWICQRGGQCWRPKIQPTTWHNSRRSMRIWPLFDLSLMRALQRPIYIFQKAQLEMLRASVLSYTVAEVFHAKPSVNRLTTSIMA